MKIELNNIYKIDVLEGLSLLDDKSVDLIILDPPYNIGKDDWDKIENYLEWIFSILKQCERVLKKTGSLYLFHNDFEVMSDFQYWIKRNTSFIFRNLIIWNKKFEGCKSEAYMDIVISTNKNRTYRKYAEYCLFYTFKDIADLNYSGIMSDIYKPYRDLIKSQMDNSGFLWNDRVIVEALLKNGIGKNYAVSRQISQNKLNYNYNQMSIMSQKEYDVLFPIIKFSVSYADLFSIYSNLNKQFREERKKHKIKNKFKLSSMRYTFNKTKKHSVMNFQVPQEEDRHICQKPEDMISEIISVSSNDGDVVLDPFLGSGTTVFVARRMRRKFIGFEKDKKQYEKIIKKL